jgi:hypothetical protein
MKGKTLLAGLAMLLSGCGGPSIEDYKGRGPAMDIREYLNGEVEAWGVYINRSGMVEEQFHVLMIGKFDKKAGTLEETLTYTDGKVSKRTWTVTFSDDNHFTSTAGDVVGVATGVQFGNAVNMNYVLRVPVKNTTYDITMDDWMYRLDEKTLINRVEMRKFGFKVGELLLTYRKKS